MFDYLGIQQRIEKFDLEHGFNAIMYGEGWLLFPDAAIRETNPLGALKEPPEDQYQCAKLKAKYCEIRLSLTVQEFTAHKRQLLNQTDMALRDGITQPPSEEALKQLKDLKKKVQSYQAKLDAARVEVENNEPVHLRERKLSMQANREKAESLLASLKEIEV